MVKNKKRARELLAKLKAKSKEKRELKWYQDLFGLKFWRLQGEWDEIESELFKECFCK